MIAVEMLFVVAAIYGAYRGIQEMGRATAGRYRKVLGSWQASRAAKSPAAAAKPAPLGVKLGAGIATGLFGGVTAAKGFAAGWKQGWPEGKQRGADWWEQRRTPVTEPHPTAETDPNGVQFCKTCGGTLPEHGKHCPDRLARQNAPAGKSGACSACNSKLGMRVGGVCLDCLAGRDPHATARALQDEEDEQIGNADTVDELAARRDKTPINTPKENTVAIDTVTGGEVYTLEDVRAEAETIKKEAMADLEDAQADSQRACEDNTRIEMFAASLRVSQYGDYAIQHIESMSESSASRKQAADQRAAAAESRLAQVEAFLTALETPEGLRA